MANKKERYKCRNGKEVAIPEGMEMPKEREDKRPHGQSYMEGQIRRHDRVSQQAIRTKEANTEADAEAKAKKSTGSPPPATSSAPK